MPASRNPNYNLLEFGHPRSIASHPGTTSGTSRTTNLRPELSQICTQTYVKSEVMLNARVPDQRQGTRGTDHSLKPLLLRTLDCDSFRNEVWQCFFGRWTEILLIMGEEIPRHKIRRDKVADRSLILVSCGAEYGPRRVSPRRLLAMSCT